MKLHTILGSFVVLALASSGNAGHEATISTKYVQAVPPLTRATTLREALRLLPISAGDFVRVTSTEVSNSLGIAGLTGRVTETPPRGSGGKQPTQRPQVTGQFMVFVTGQNREIAVPGHLIDLISLAPGGTVAVDGRVWISTDDGDWKELCGDEIYQRPHFIYP